MSITEITWTITHKNLMRKSKDELASMILREIDATDQAIAALRAHEADHNTLTCAYCGQQFPPGTPRSNHDLLFEHITRCERHPIAQCLKHSALVVHPELGLMTMKDAYEYERAEHYVLEEELRTLKELEKKL